MSAMARLFDAIEEKCPGFKSGILDLEAEQREWASAIKERQDRHGEDPIRHCLGYTVERLKPEPIPDLWAFLGILDMELQVFSMRQGQNAHLARGLREVEKQADNPNASEVAKREIEKMRRILKGKGTRP